MNMNQMHVIHTLLYFIYLKIFYLGILVYDVSTVWEDTNGCAKQYRCALDACLMNVLSYAYVIIMDSAINAPVRGNNFFDGINATDKLYLKAQMELIGKLSNNDTSKFGILPSASKEVSIKFTYQCINILNNKEILNVFKGIKKFKRENHYLDINHVYTIFKGTMILITEV